MIIRKCWETFSYYIILHYLLSLAGKSLRWPVLGKILFICLPAAICACSVPEEESAGTEEATVIRLMNTECDSSLNMTSDVFIFNDDRMQKLDTYQQIMTSVCSGIEACSSSGNKIFTIIANSNRERYDWTRVNNRNNLKEEYFMLENESREMPLSSGEYSTKAGFNFNIEMQKLRAEVILRSICCDFSGKSYHGSKLKNTKVYLSNVNAEAAIITDEPYRCRRIINRGGLNMGDIEAMKDPGLLFQEIKQDIGTQKIYPDIRLGCYPNECSEEDIGSPFTRLVIEAEIEGKVYYWPLNINRDKEGKGVSRNRQYIYDIKIKRCGHTDPDTAIEFSDMDTIIEAREWEEREEYGVRF